MTVKRLRPLPSEEELHALYSEPHDHRFYGQGHGERVQATINLARGFYGVNGCPTIADLSCGNGVIARALCPRPEGRHLGDYAGPVQCFLGESGYIGPLEQTLDLVPITVHGYVLSETLEHLDNPAVVLDKLSTRSATLVLSTPLECWHDTNDEHLWAWDREGVESLAAQASWTPAAFTTVDSREYGEPYLYGIWVFK